MKNQNKIFYIYWKLRSATMLKKMKKNAKCKKYKFLCLLKTETQRKMKENKAGEKSKRQQIE